MDRSKEMALAIRRYTWTGPKEEMAFEYISMLESRLEAARKKLAAAERCTAIVLVKENTKLCEEIKEAQNDLEAAQKEHDELKNRCEKLEAQLTAEEQRAMESGGILSDVCDLVFDDPERAATHGYNGVHNKIAEIKNQLRLYQLGVGKYCADFCTETKDGLGPCYTCALGKL